MSFPFMPRERSRYPVATQKLKRSHIVTGCVDRQRGMVSAEHVSRTFFAQSAHFHRQSERIVAYDCHICSIQVGFAFAVCSSWTFASL